MRGITMSDDSQYALENFKRKAPSSNAMPQMFKPPEGVELLGNIGQAVGGGLSGLAQGGSNIGRNIAQFPFDVASYFTGKPAYQTPQSDYFKEQAPDTALGHQAEHVGEVASPFVASPAIAAETMLGKAMFGGKVLPRLITDMLLGASESESGSRKQGAALGAAAPALGKVIKKIKETPLTEAGAVKKLQKAKTLAGQENLGIPLPFDFMNQLDYLMGTSHLRPSRMQLNKLIGDASHGTYPAYFDLQSALGDVSRELLHPAPTKGKGILGMLGQYLNPPQSSAAERLTGHQLEKLRKDYISQAMEHLNKTGKGKVAQLETQGKKEYSNYKRYVPIRNKAALTALIGALGAAGFKGGHWVKDLMQE